MILTYDDYVRINTLLFCWPTKHYATLQASIFRSNPLLAMMGSGGFEDLNEGGNTVDADGDQDGDFSASGDKQDEDGDNEDQSGVTIVE